MLQFVLMPIYKVGRLTDLLQEPPEPTQWLINGWLPRFGIGLLHAKFSIGKSPLTWKMAQSVSDGIDFFGQPVCHQGPIVLVESDMNWHTMQPRLALLDPVPSQLHFVGITPFNCLAMPSGIRQQFERLQHDVNPCFVIVDTLRKVYIEDTDAGSTPSRVYQTWHNLFPNAFVLFVHHDKKTQFVDGVEVVNEESFTGRQEWANDAVVAYHLTQQGNRRSKKLKLEMTRSQMCELPEPLILQLGANGVSFSDTLASTIAEKMSEIGDIPRLKAYASVAKQLGVSISTVQRMLREHELAPSKTGLVT